MHFSLQAAFECMYTLLDSCLDRLDIFEFLNHLEDGLKDHYDVKVRNIGMKIRGNIQGVLIKRNAGQTWPVSLKLDKHLNHFGYFLLEGYLLFLTVPRNVGSVMSVNENEHLKNSLTI